MASLIRNIGAARTARDLKGTLLEQCQTKAEDLHRNLVRRSCPLSASQLLHAVRGHDLSSYSDGQLYEEMARLGNGVGKDVHSGALPRAFAVVKESVERRLGAWRIFDPSFSCGWLEVYRQAADQLIRTAVDTVGTFSLGSERDATVSLIIESKSSTVQEDLDPDARILVDTLAKVQDSLRWKGGSDVLLPAEFYQALSRKDVAGEVRFEVTDEQLLSGIHLYRGSIVEMYSGEGKTIAAAFPAVMHAVEGRAVHIVTANDYLAFRDSQLLAPVYKSLGVSVDAVMNYMIDEERREAYANQIVYGTMREFGFDYLRDNVKIESMERVQRGLYAVIVDEADQCLIDDAATPMIIAGQSASSAGELLNVKNAVTELIARQREVVDELHVELSQSPNDSKPQMQILAQLWVADQDHQEINSLCSEDSKIYKRVQSIIYPEGSEFPDQGLTVDLFFAVDPHLRFVTLTDRGQAFLQSRLGKFYDARDLELELERISSNKTLSTPQRRDATSRLTHQLDLRYRTGNQVYQMLRALVLLKKDADYLVAEDSILLLDRHTGRHRPDSRYQEGLQTALEAKEGLAVRPEGEVLGQISVQGFVNKYRTLTGMTGTATSATDEFKRNYGLNVMTMPTSMPLMRRDLGYRVYKTKKDKLAAIVEEVALCHRVGRPVLVGTSTIEQSEEVSRLLCEKDVPHNLLNAVTCQYEAQIIRDAGAFGAVTVATNIAGRGTDILLHNDLTPRILYACTQLIRDALVQGATAVRLRCLTQEESNMLSADLKLQREFSVVQNRRGQDIELIATLRGAQDVRRVDWEPGVQVDFGLGLHVIGTELNESPRVELQMRGRSGRQGQFGSSTVLLSFEDSLLVSNGAPSVCAQGCAKVDQGSREYWDGERVNDHIRRIQQRVDRDAEMARSFAQDYASIIDAQTCLYYSARQDIMNVGSLFSRCLKAAEAIGGRIADRHFPGLDVTNYRTQFSRMVEDVAVDYGADCNDLFGVGLNQLGASIGRVIDGRVKMVRSAVGVEVFDRLARLLLLETCDEAWREHISTLHELRRTSQLFNHGRHSAVAECIGHSYHAWDDFQSNVDEAFLAKLLHFSVDEIAGTTPGLAPQITLADDAVLVLT